MDLYISSVLVGDMHGIFGLYNAQQHHNRFYPTKLSQEKVKWPPQTPRTWVSFLRFYVTICFDLDLFFLFVPVTVLAQLTLGSGRASIAAYPSTKASFRACW